VGVIVIVGAAIVGVQQGGLNTVLQGAASAFTALAVVFLGGLAVLLIVKMANGTIDLKYVIAGEDGDASLSRFQMLLFTFVVAGLYFVYALYALFSIKSGSACPGSLSDQIQMAAGATNDALTAANAEKASAAVIAAATKAKAAADGLNGACLTFSLPGIPTTVLGLIGISGGSYLLSKGIQAAATQGPSNGTSTGGATPAGQTAPVRRNVNQ
jgi:hypothetical protein